MKEIPVKKVLDLVKELRKAAASLKCGDGKEWNYGYEAGYESALDDILDSMVKSTVLNEINQ